MHALRTGLASAVAAVALLASAAASAEVITIGDNLLVRGWTGSNGGAASGSWGWVDSVTGTPDDWNTTRIEVERGTGNGLVTFRLFTNKNDDADGGVPFGDFFIDLDPDHAIAGPFDNWDIAVDFQHGGLSGGRYGQGGLYLLDGSVTDGDADWFWSTQLGIGGTYGGRIRNTACGTADTPSAALQALGCQTLANAALGATRVNTAVADFQGALALNYLDIGTGDGRTTVISFSIAEAILGADFDIYWGTGECANDSIWGPVAATPEPAAIAMFGIGLLGAYAGLRRRRPTA